MLERSEEAFLQAISQVNHTTDIAAATRVNRLESLYKIVSDVDQSRAAFGADGSRSVIFNTSLKNGVALLFLIAASLFALVLRRFWRQIAAKVSGPRRHIAVL